MLRDAGAVTFADGSGGHTVPFGGAAAAGDLLILGVNADTTVSTPAGYSLAVSDVQNQGAYVFWRKATGGEASVAVATGGDLNTAVTVLRYAGSASLPADQVAAAAVINNSGTVTPAVSPAALAEPGGLALLFGCLHAAGGGAASSPVPSAGYSVLLDTGRIGGGASSAQQFVSGRTDAAGVETPGLSWTGAADDRTALFVSFLPAP